jgi:tetratricopeptide (TPR) repeat protein
MRWDFNVLEKLAHDLVKAGRPQDAIRVYFQMADGDPSLDGGHLGKKIGQCYESMGQLYAAKYWYGRAVEENPEVRKDCAEARQKLEAIVNIDDLIKREEYELPPGKRQRKGLWWEWDSENKS